MDSINLKVARLHRFETDGAMKAFADVVINDALVIKGLRVVEGKKGVFVSMPQQQGKDRKWYDTVLPLTPEVRDEITRVILEAYKGE